MALGGGAALAGRAAVEVYPDLANFQKELTAKLAPITGKMGKVSKGTVAGVAGITVAAAAAGKALYDVGATFDEASDTIRVQTGATGKHLAKLQEDFKKVYASVPADSKTVADAIGSLNSRLQVQGKPLQKLSRQFVELSRITGTDLDTNIQNISRAFKDASIPTNKQSGALDQLFRVSEKSGASISSLTDLMVRFGSPLRQLGFNFQTSAAMFAKFEAEGVNVQTAMPGLRMALKNFAAAGKDPQKALQGTFEQIRKAPSIMKANTIAFETFGTRAGPDLAAAVREGRFSYGDLVKDMKKGKGTITDAAKDTNDFGENWEILKHKLAVAVSPAASFVFDKINQGLSALTRLNLQPTIDSLKRFWKESGVARTIIGTLWDSAKKAFAGIKQAASGAFQGIKGAVKIISGVLTGDWGRAWDGVKDLFKGGAKIVVGVLRTVTAPIRSVASTLGKAFDGPWKKIKGVFSDGVDAVIGFVNLIVDAVNAVLPGNPLGHVGGGKNRDSYTGPASSRPMNPIGAHATGGKVMTPSAIVGEEAPRHPEYVIASNPKYRQRNLGLWAAAGSDLGIPGFAIGGILNKGLNVAKDVGGGIVEHSPAGFAFKGAKAVKELISRMPSVSMLPEWLRGLGSDTLKGATNWAEGKIPGLFKGGVLGYNRTYPRTSLGAGGKTLSPNVTAAIAEYAGLPGVTFSQIAHGESGYAPGMVSSDGGYGMWQMTPRTWPSALVKRMQGIGSYFNPVANAKMAKVLFADRGIAPWYGQRYVTGSNQHYKGKLTNSPVKTGKGKGSAKAKKLGMGSLQNRIDATSNQADIWADYAERADSIGASVFGFDQLHWLQAELFELMKLRDMLIAALEQLQVHLAAVGQAVGAKVTNAAKAKQGSAGAGGILANLKNNAWVDSHTLTVAKYIASKFGLTMTSGHRTRAHNAAINGAPNSLHLNGTDANPGATDFVPIKDSALAWVKANVAGLKEAMFDNVGNGWNMHIGYFAKGGILPGFKKGAGAGATSKATKNAAAKVKAQRDAITQKISDTSSALTDLQGIGSPTTKGGAYPLGALGGRILDVQQSIRDYGSDGTANGGGSTGLSIEGLKSIMALRDLGVRFNTDQFAGVFHSGGIVPGPYGQERTAIVRAGEGVFTADQMAAMGGPSGMEAHIYIGGEKIEEQVEIVWQKKEHEQGLAQMAGA